MRIKAIFDVFIHLLVRLKHNIMQIDINIQKLIRINIKEVLC